MNTKQFQDRLIKHIYNLNQLSDQLHETGWTEYVVNCDTGTFLWRPNRLSINPPDTEVK